jgi:hypothetical protein
MKRFKYIFIIIGLMIGVVSLGAGVWTTSYADVDGDGTDEGIDYVIGVNGEHNIPYVYLPTAHFIAWNTARTCMGIQKLRQVILENGTRILDTGEPYMPNWDEFNYIDTYYDTMYSYYDNSNGTIVTHWESQYAILERIVSLNDIYGINRYKLWKKCGTTSNYLGETALLAVWNDGMTTIDQAKQYVLDRLLQYKSVFADSFAGLTTSDNIIFKAVYVFDDYVSRLDNFTVLCWDGSYYQYPDTRAIWGTLHLPEPCTLRCEVNSAPSTEHTFVYWQASCSQVSCLLRIEPEVINLKSHGVFTAFITFPGGYDPGKVNLTTIQCEGAKAYEGFVMPGAYITKFHVQDLVGMGPGVVPFLLTGQFYDGTQFSGVDTIRVIMPGTTKLASKPNPCRDHIVFSPSDSDAAFSLTGAGIVRIRVYDNSGCLVRTLTGKSSAEIDWNLTDEHGKNVPPGVYFCVYESGDNTLTSKITVLR